MTAASRLLVQSVPFLFAPQSHPWRWRVDNFCGKHRHRQAARRKEYPKSPSLPSTAQLSLRRQHSRGLVNKTMFSASPAHSPQARVARSTDSQIHRCNSGRADQGRSSCNLFTASLPNPCPGDGRSCIERRPRYPTSLCRMGLVDSQACSSLVARRQMSQRTISLSNEGACRIFSHLWMALAAALLSRSWRARVKPACSSG